jgi:hypothetical protein
MRKCIAAFLCATLAFGGAAVAQSDATPAPNARRATERAPAQRATERAPAQARVEQQATDGELRVTRTLDAKAWQPGEPIAMRITATAPAGSRMERVSLNTSLMAALMAALSTSTTPSTSSRHSRKVSQPTCAQGGARGR